MVFRSEFYGVETLKETENYAVIKVGLRYHLRHGEQLCESRVFPLTREQPRVWTIGTSDIIEPRPNCDL